MRPELERGPLLDWERSRRVSEGITALRAASGLPQGQLAEALQMSQAFVSVLEQGGSRWRERTAEAAAGVLGTDLAALLGGGGLCTRRRAGRPPRGGLLGPDEGMRAAAGMRRFREERGLSQAQLAVRLFQSRGWVGAREEGRTRMTAGEAEQVAAVLGTDLAGLLGGAG